MENPKNMLVGVLGIVLTVIILFIIVGGMSNTVVDSARSITDANNCSDGSLLYNQTSKYCMNSTGNNLYLAKQYDLPLSDLFGESGIALIALMAGLLVTIIVLAIRKVKGG